MKTPKELLLQRYEHAGPKLDAIRDHVMREHVKREGVKRGTVKDGVGEMGRFWRRLLWPSPAAWAGVAAAWVLIAGLNLSDGGNGSSTYAGAQVAQRSPERLEALREQRRLFAELVNSPGESEEAEPPRHIPRPRSACPPNLVCV